jgi:hypothetical protein
MFYFVRQDVFNDDLNIIEIVGHTDVTGDHYWTSGTKIEGAIPKETLLLDAAYGTELPDFFDTTIPVASQRLIELLRGAGVDNFDAYPVLLKRQDTGEEFDGYAAINVLGSVDAVDSALSVHRLRFGEPDFTGSIVIDEKKTRGLEFFRLLHGPDFIVASDRVAHVLKEARLPALLLQPTTDYEGN